MKPRNRAKLAVRRSPALWSSYVAVRFPTQAYKDASDAVCLPRHDLLLDGYPRSANSYLFNFLTRFHDDVDCVHHAHASATLEMARRFDVPAFVLLRDPLDAVTSNVIRSGGNLGYHEAHYEQYYGYVHEHLDDVTVVPFEAATRHPVSVLERLETELGLPHADPDPAEVEAANRSIEDHLEALAADKYGDAAEDKKAVPDADRDEQKARVKDELHQRPDIEKLRGLYREILHEAERAGTRLVGEVKAADM
jgi:hypothetical protein